MYRALISDIDNTLVGVKDGTDIDDATATAAKRAIRRGVHIGLASGRGWHSTKSIATRLGIVDPCIVEGGGCIVDPRDRACHLGRSVMSAAASRRVVEIFRQYSPKRRFGEIVGRSGSSSGS